MVAVGEVQPDQAPLFRPEVVRLRESLPKSYTSGLQAKKVRSSAKL